MGIEVLPPDVNDSELDFAPAPGERSRRSGTACPPFATSGREWSQQIIDARRDEGGVHLVLGLLPQGGARGAVEEGAREPDLRRRVRLARLRAAGRCSRTRRRCRRRSRPNARRRPPGSSRCSAAGTGRRPEIDESVLDGEEFDKRTLLRFEKEMLGQFVTDHPLLEVKDAARRADRPRALRAREPRRRGPGDGRRHHRRASRASSRREASRTRSSGSRTLPAG